MNTGRFSKGIVSALGAIMAGLNTYYAGNKWETIAAGALATAGVVAVPNLPAVSSPSHVVDLARLEEHVSVIVDRLLAARLRPRPAAPPPVTMNVPQAAPQNATGGNSALPAPSSTGLLPPQPTGMAQ